jgi:hypothetical protein
MRFLVYFQELESFNYMKDLRECRVRVPPSLLLSYSIVMQEQTLSVCVLTVDKAAVLCLDFTRPGSWVALHSSHYEGSLSVIRLRVIKLHRIFPLSLLKSTRVCFDSIWNEALKSVYSLELK